MMLFVYVFGNLNTLMPIAKDAFSHLFFEETHIASVHLENGRYHLHLEVKNQAEKSGDSKSSASKTQTTDFLYAHIVSDCLALTKSFSTPVDFFDNYKNSFPEFSVKPISPPPKQLD